jgi:uncharacterized repeat protein (TIGR02543 family)
MFSYLYKNSVELFYQLLRRFVVKNKRVFSGFLLMLIGGVFMSGIVGCDNGTTNSTITQYTVTFNANGGQVSPSTKTVEEGKTLSSLPTPTKTSGDTIFQGWYTKDGTNNGWGTEFTKTTIVNSDITVYARWGSVALVKYTVTFNPDGGTVNPTTIQVNSGDPAGALPVPKKDNNTFDGWWTEQNGGGTRFTETTSVDGNTTVYAKWTATIYGCIYSQKTDTYIDSNGNKSTQYLLSISYEDALVVVKKELGEPQNNANSLFWSNSDITTGESWIILEFNEFHYVENSSSSRNVVRLLSKETGGKQWSWERNE